MKETNAQPTDKIEIVKQTAIKKELNFLATVKLHKNHSFFKLNLLDGTVSTAKYEIPKLKFISNNKKL